MPTGLPDEATNIRYSQERRRCGKPDCPACRASGQGHGPYWFAHWVDALGKEHQHYLGKTLPVDGSAPVAAVSVAPSRRTAPLRAVTMGRFAVWRGPTEIPRERWTAHPKAASLFKCLLDADRHAAHVEQLAEWIHDDLSADVALERLKGTTVRTLREILGERPGARGNGYLRLEGEICRLAPALDDAPGPDWLDAAAFARAAATALDGRSIAACQDALGRYTGEYLPDDPYDDWAIGRREALRATHHALLLHLGRLCQDEAERSLEQLVRHDPDHEEATRLLMRQRAALGKGPQAIADYLRLREALRRDLDVAPAAETKALYEALIRTPNNLPAPTAVAIERPALVAELRSQLLP